jgi:hypothetical protein
MNYKKIYDQLVEKCKVRGLNKSALEGYFEKHHIVPKCMGGSDDPENFVLFTGREHFIAHMLLMRAYPESTSLMRAAFMMSSRWQSGGLEQGKPIHSKTYENLRILYAQAVSVQCSGENNPMFGTRHPEHIMDKIKATRAKTQRKKSLVSWKQNNARYMSQFTYKERVIKPFLENVGSTFDVFRFKGELSDWLSFQAYKDFWKRSGKSGPKDFSTKVQKVSGKKFSGTYFKTMIERFNQNYNPSENPDFVVKALNNNCDEYITQVEQSLVKTLEELEKDYIDSWMQHRESNRDKIKKALDFLKVEKHKYNSKAKFSLIDVTEALILWRSGFVEQKFLSELYGVARNSVSNSLETKERWVGVKNNINQIEDIVFDGYYCSSQ